MQSHFWEADSHSTCLQSPPPFCGKQRFIYLQFSQELSTKTCPEPIEPNAPTHSTWLTLILSCHVRLTLPIDLLPSVFFTFVTCNAHIVLVSLITQVMFGEDFTLWNSPLYIVHCTVQNTQIAFFSLLYFLIFRLCKLTNTEVINIFRNQRFKKRAQLFQDWKV